MDLGTKAKIIISWIIGLLIIGAAVFDYFQLSMLERAILFLIGAFIIIIF